MTARSPLEALVGQSRRNLSVLPPAHQEVLGQALPLGGATEGGYWILRRERNHVNGLAVVQPGESIAIMDLVPFTDCGGDVGLSLLGAGCFHGRNPFQPQRL